MNRTRLLHTATAALLTLVLGGCGWHLRGSADGHAVTSLNLKMTQQAHGKLARALEEQMRLQHIADGGDTAWTLVILDQQLKSHTLAFSDTNNAANDELELEVRFLVNDAAGVNVIPPSTERFTRTYDTESNRRLATDREAELVNDEVYRTMAERLLRRINYVAEHPAASQAKNRQTP